MKVQKKIVLFVMCFSLSGCGTENKVAAQMESIKSINDLKRTEESKPLSLLMPSANYNQRPENTKIDTVVIHHTAPFPSLTRVGYFFQNTDSRVSAHYTVGKEGLIIESVAENDRAWHGGLSSWLGKYGLNDYSIGIELLNDGDHKDPFTEPQYDAVAKLTAYLLKKYNIPVDRVIGHRDIAIPMGRKIDPADNFDWKYFKSKIRRELNQSQSFFGWGDMPRDNLPPENQIRKQLLSKTKSERAEALRQLLTFPMKNLEEDIKAAYYNETDPEVKIQFLNLFNWYENKGFISSAREIMADNSSDTNLRAAAIRYLSVHDREFSLPEFHKMIKQQAIPQGVTISLINALSSSKDANSKSILTEILKTTQNTQLKKEIIASLANFSDKSLNPLVMEYIKPGTDFELRATAIESLRVTYDERVEKAFLDLVNDSNYNHEITEDLAWVFIRNKSPEGMSIMMRDSFYDMLTPKVKIALLNTIAQIKMSETEDWVIDKTSQAKDENVKAAGFLALGRLGGEKSFNYLLNNFNYNLSPELNFVTLKALSNYDKPEVNAAIGEILEKSFYPSEIKLLAISTIKDKNLKNFIPHLENALKTTK